MINVSKLRELTDQAIAKGEEENRLKLQRIEESKIRQKKADELFAEKVLSQIPDKCEKAATNGRSHVVIMDLRDKDYEHKTGNRPPTENELKGAGYIVYAYCLQAKLAPTIEFWHDGVGIKSGYQIVVHW